MKGAPIRFIAAVVGGWACVRMAVLLPEADPLELARDVLAPPAQAAARSLPRSPSPGEAMLSRHRATPMIPRGAKDIAAASSARSGLAAALTSAANTQVIAPAERPPSRDTPAPLPVAPVLMPTTPGFVSGDAPPRSWSASTWLLARGGTGGTLSGGQLGASQTGVRLLYRIDRAHRLSLAGRVATPLRGHGAEAAVGVDWQPSAAPIHLVVEQRFGLDGSRGGPTAMVIVGLNPTPVAAGFRLEAYAQGGAILRDDRMEAFGDGAARLTRSIATVGRATIDLGGGAWAAGQRGAERADIGPTIGVALPVAGRGVRLSLDWRQRVAGRARPDSGLAVSIGSDF